MTQCKPLQNWKFLIITEYGDVQGSDDAEYVDWLQSYSDAQVFEGIDSIPEDPHSDDYEEYLREQEEDGDEAD